MNDPHFTDFDEQLMRTHAGQIRAGFLEPGPADPYTREPSECLCSAQDVVRRELRGFPLWVVWLVAVLALVVWGTR